MVSTCQCQENTWPFDSTTIQRFKNNQFVSLSTILCIFFFFLSTIQQFKGLKLTRPAWAGFKTAEEGRTKIM